MILQIILKSKKSYEFKNVVTIIQHDPYLTIECYILTKKNETNSHDSFWIDDIEELKLTL